MQMNEIILDRDLRELTKRGSPSFPIEMYDTDFAKLISGEFPWHWHNEVEFVLILDGSILAETQHDRIVLREREAIFFNSNTLHAMSPASKGLCRAAITVFDPRIISGEPHSLIEQKYVQPMVHENNIAMAFTGDGPGQQQRVPALLQEVYDAFVQKEYGFEIEIRNLLSSIWLSMIRSRPVDETDKKADDTRIKGMLEYIHNHYMNTISMKDVADSVDVSTRECNRCFQRQIGMTPFHYLHKYRMRLAEEMLTNTDDSITEICYNCGFNGTSYFSRKFREETGFAPREFRKKAKESSRGSSGNTRL